MIHAERTGKLISVLEDFSCGKVQYYYGFLEVLIERLLLRMHLY
jgi:hypothetical protein